MKEFTIVFEAYDCGTYIIWLKANNTSEANEKVYSIAKEFKNHNISHGYGSGISAIFEGFHKAISDDDDCLPEFLDWSER